MLRSEFNRKNLLLGEGVSFEESFSLVLDEGRGSYTFLIQINHDLKRQVVEDLAKSLNDSFKEKFLSLDLDLFDRFEAGLLKMNEIYVDVCSDEEIELDVSAVLLAEGNGKVMFTRTGHAEIYLVRDESFMNVSDAIEFDSDSEEIFDNVVSGDLKVKDHYVLATSRLLRYVSESGMVREISRLGFDGFCTWLSEKVEFELDGKVLISVLFCKDTLYEKVKEVVQKDWKYYLRNFKRNFWVVLKSVLTGDIGSINPELRNKVGGALLVLIALFVGSSLWFAHHSAVMSEVARYEDELDVAQLIINNAKSEFDKEKIALMLQNAEAKISSARGVDALEEESRILLEQIKDIKSSVDNVVTVESVDLVQNVIGPAEVNYSLESLHVEGNTLYAVSQNRLFSFVSGIEKDPVTFDPGEGIYDYVWAEGLDTVYGLTSDNGVIRVGDGLANNLDVDGGEINVGESGVFYSNRIYILDKDNNQIWRHDVGRSGVGGGVSYLQEGYGRFLDGAKDIAIDGYVYVVTEGGDFFRFFRGALDDQFRVTEKPMVALLNPTNIYTNIDIPYMFVLEPSEQRIIQYFKSESEGSMSYVRQYYFPELENIVDFDIDYLAEKIYLIDDRSVYSTDLDVSLN